MFTVLLSALLAQAPLDGTAHALSVAGALSAVDAHGALDYRLHLGSGWQVGLESRFGAVRESYIDGYRTDGGWGGSALLFGVAPLVRREGLELGLLVGAGARTLDADSSLGPHSRSVSLLTRLGPTAALAIDDQITLRLAWCNVVDLQLDPGTDLEALGQLVSLGVHVVVHDELQLFADAEIGGTLGFDGDGTKLAARGVVGARWVFGGHARAWKLF